MKKALLVAWNESGLRQSLIRESKDNMGVVINTGILGHLIM